MKRTLKSPGRILSLLFFLGYNGWLFGRLFIGGRANARTTGLDQLPKFDFTAPTVPAVSGVVFLLFAALVCMNVLGLGGFRAHFRAPDADVLFPTPVSPKVVVAWRVVSDTMLRMLFPLLFAGIALTRGRDSLGTLRAAEYFPAALKLAVVGYLLLAVGFALWGWGISLWGFSPRNVQRRTLAWIFGGQVAYIAIGVAAGYIVFRNSPGFDTVVSFANHPAVRAYFFPAHVAERFAMGVADGGYLSTLLGLAGLLAFAGLGSALAMRFAPNLYEQAALRAYQVKDVGTRARQEGSSYSATLSRAERGSQGLGFTLWLYKWRAQGTWAVLWKESLLAMRVGFVQAIVSTLVGVVATVLIARYAPDRAAAIFGPVLCALGPIFASPSTRATVLPEALARLDLVKPLPFTSRQLLVWDAMARSLVPLAVSLPIPIVAAVTGVTPIPTAFLAWLTGAVYAVTVAVAFLPVAILQPDARDPAQASVRGLAASLVFLPLSGLAVAPPVLAAIARIPVWVGLLASIVALAAVTAGIALLAASMYDRFNPADP